MTLTPKYPHVVVDLIGQDGNAFAIMDRVRQALKANDVPQSEVDLFFSEATSGDYDNLLQVVMKWVSTDEPQEDDDWYILDESDEALGIDVYDEDDPFASLGRFDD